MEKLIHLFLVFAPFLSALALFVIFVSIITIGIDRWDKRKTFRKFRDKLMSNLFDASNTRKAWREAYPNEDIRNLAYQKLWNLQIGAEAALNLHTGEIENLSFNAWKRESLEHNYKYS